ncbi:MAG: hypothetical protein ACHQKZ_02325 [Solirubrobacterales bacterium]|jgi:hypothetical protein
MRSIARPASVLVLVSALSGNTPLRAQPPVPDLSGAWLGRATLTNDWPGFTCRYEGADDPPSVRLELRHEGAQWTGSVAIDMAPAGDSGCPPLAKRYTIPVVHVGEGTLGFTDSGGHEWNLSVRRGEGLLKGMVAWKTGDEPLAQGFTVSGGATPLTRLSGEVRLARATAPVASATGTAAGAEPAGGGSGAAAGAATGAAPDKVTAGKRAGHLAGVIGANIVAVGVLYGVNKVGKSSNEGGVVTCSPRYCIIASLGEPCLCNANVLSGAPCGSTASGAPQQGVCNQTDLPCQSGLSCNAGVCQDRFGSCPF